MIHKVSFSVTKESKMETTGYDADMRASGFLIKVLAITIRPDCETRGARGFLRAGIFHTLI